METKETKSVLILGLTPEFLEKSNLLFSEKKKTDWFNENRTQIIESIKKHSWWQDQGIIIEENAKLSPSELRRKLVNLNYEKTDRAELPGEFSSYGNIIDIAPINERKRYKIEFYGNWIERIEEQKIESITFPRTHFHTDHLKHLSNLKPGDFIVHIDHGIGILRGFMSGKEFSLTDPYEGEKSYFVIEYAPPRTGGEPDKLFIPQEQARKLSRYIGFSTPEIHRLSSQVWFETKKKIKEDAQKFARELFGIYVERAKATRPPHRSTVELEKMAEANADFLLTQDQERAVKETINDLHDQKPMDRVLIGDVGFGKTEVALRAMLHVVGAGAQVLFLAPTTILAQQHFETLRERLKSLPIHIGLLTRLISKRKEKEAVKELNEGKLDIVVGTHRLFGRDLHPKNLGLLVIDEEQRFGVRHKEHFKKLRPHLDILSLSATPIPRTLSLTMAKLRDVSEIHTPPPGKEPIETFVAPKSKRLMQEAIKKELERKGQIYFLENRISHLKETKEILNRLVKGVAIGIIHGKLPEKEIIEVMENFREKKTQLLLATTIIENGLDLSNVNTLIVSDATRLGLAQAHQLRGRIGRPTHDGKSEKAYAYFLYHSGHLPDKARERLRTLKELNYLGAGHQIAMMDLELRGAGNILGKEQSGSINAVGLNLYSELLSESVENLKRLYEFTSLEADRRGATAD